MDARNGNRKIKYVQLLVFEKAKSCFPILISSSQVVKEGVSHGEQDFYIQVVALMYHTKPNKEVSYVEHECGMAFVSSGCHSHLLYNSCSKISF